MPTPVAKAMYAPTMGIISSQESFGTTPLASAKTNTAMKFIPRLKIAVRDTDSGITMRGKRTFRSIALAHDQTRNASRCRFEKVVPEHDRCQQVDGIVRDAFTELEHVREDDVEDAEEHERLDQRPEVAEHRSEIAELELGPGQRQG